MKLMNYLGTLWISVLYVCFQRFFCDREKLCCIQLNQVSLCRYHHSIDHDNFEYHCEKIITPCLLCHRYGFVCDCMLSICLCCSDGVCNPQLLFKL